MREATRSSAIGGENARFKVADLSVQEHETGIVSQNACEAGCCAGLVIRCLDANVTPSIPRPFLNGPLKHLTSARPARRSTMTGARR